MKIVYYDCFAGISGDMNLAAMIDLGVEADYLRGELGKLGLGDEFEVVVSQSARSGIHGTRVDVRLAGETKEHAHHHDHGHTHEHAHDKEHGHCHGHSHGPNRNFADIRELINGSGLAKEVKATALRIFQKVAGAEAKVHGKPVDEVHFHEVGATDSIVDIVGAAICYHRLGVDEVWASPIELGGGFVNCVHGRIPVPAPATVEILQGIPTTRGGTTIEATTPTGAAILAGLVDQFTATPAMTVTRTGYGIGHTETERPNLVRVHLAEVKQSTFKTSRARLLQCNIDDMTAEAMGHALELFMEEGAMDVHFTPVVMKKVRPATMISLLCSEEEEDRFKELIFRHTTTLGVKSVSLEKTELERRFDTVETRFGPVTVKRTLMGGEVIRSKPEFDECREIARREGITLAEVSKAVAEADTE